MMSQIKAHLCRLCRGSNNNNNMSTQRIMTELIEFLVAVPRATTGTISRRKHSFMCEIDNSLQTLSRKSQTLILVAHC